MPIKRPQKAPSESITDEQLEKIFETHEYVLGSPKLDGYRITTDNVAYTSSMKLIKNKYAQSILSKPEYCGLDGEGVVGRPDNPDCFKPTKKALSRADGEPDFKLYVFDCIINRSMPYELRVKFTKDLCKSLPFAVWVNQVKLHSVAAVKAFEDKCVKMGYEGAMVRLPGKPYKEGRCTLKEENIFKRKPMEEDEAIIISFEEQMQNNNPKVKNEMGQSIRSNHKANKVGKGTMGAIWLRSPKWGIDFKISGGKGDLHEGGICPGIDAPFRQWLWDNREYLIGKIITYKYQKYGSDKAPRIPTYKAFTDPDTITDY